MLPRNHSPHSSPSNVTLRLVDPVVMDVRFGRDELANNGDNAVTSITYADFGRVMESTHRIMSIHKESFKKLAE